MQTIRSTREIDAMFRGAEKVDHSLLMLLVAPSARDTSEGRAAFVAGRRLGNAVARNRMKRVLREALRRAGGPPKAHDIVLVARKGLAQAGAADVDAAMRSVLGRARLS